MTQPEQAGEHATFLDARAWLVMGVSGSGKTTVGKALAKRLEDETKAEGTKAAAGGSEGERTDARGTSTRSHVRFHDADDFHPSANKEKMARGQPLTDDDREPWLRAIGDQLAHGEQRGPPHPDQSSSTAQVDVVTCSALKRRYRDAVRPAAGCVLVYLRGDRDTIRKRLESRAGHFFDPSLLDSQFDALEEPTDEEEPLIIVDITPPVDDIVAAIVNKAKAAC